MKTQCLSLNILLIGWAFLLGCGQAPMRCNRPIPHGTLPAARWLPQLRARCASANAVLERFVEASGAPGLALAAGLRNEKPELNSKIPVQEWKTVFNS